MEEYKEECRRDIENMIETEDESNLVWLCAEWIRRVYPLLNKYFGFEYSYIAYEILNSLRDAFDYHTTYLETGNIEHLPDDFKIYFSIDGSNYVRIINFAKRYEIGGKGVDALCILIILLYVYVKNVRNQFYGIEYGNEVYELFINEEKRKLYEFLLDNPHEFNEFNRVKARMEIRYGADSNSKIKIDNYENWFYSLLKNALYEDLTLGGRLEYDRYEEPQKPTRAPSFSNFIAYNTYLLLKAEVGSKSKFPTEFSKFIIDLCDLCEVELIERQTEVIGMKEFLSHANRQYQGEPMPLSRVK